MDNERRLELQQEQDRAWVRKNAWSRERCEDLRAIGLLLSTLNEDAAQVVQEAADFMLMVRRAERGGRLNVQGSKRHWSQDE